MKVRIPKGMFIMAWILLTILIWSLCAALLTASDGVENITGFCIALIWIVASLETKCLTKFKITKDE